MSKTVLCPFCARTVEYEIVSEGQKFYRCEIHKDMAINTMRLMLKDFKVIFIGKEK